MRQNRPAISGQNSLALTVVEVKTFEQIVRKSGVAFFAEIMADAAQGQVHLRQTVGCSFLFLTVDIDSPDIAALFPDKIGTLDKHTARAAAGVYKNAVFDTNRKSLLRHISAEKGLK